MAKSKHAAAETAPGTDYDRAARYFAQGYTREQVEDLCPGVDLHHPQVTKAARAMEKAADATRAVDDVELRRRLLEIADDDDTPIEIRVKVLTDLRG